MYEQIEMQFMLEDIARHANDNINLFRKAL